MAGGGVDVHILLPQIKQRSGASGSARSPSEVAHFRDQLRGPAPCLAQQYPSLGDSMRSRQHAKDS